MEQTLPLIGSLVLIYGLFTDNENTQQPQPAGEAEQPVIGREETIHSSATAGFSFGNKDRFKDIPCSEWKRGNTNTDTGREHVPHMHQHRLQCTCSTYEAQGGV